MVSPPMKLDSTRLVAQTLLPNTRPLRWNQAISKIRLAAPEMKHTSNSQRESRAADRAPALTVARGRVTVLGKSPAKAGSVCGNRTPLSGGGKRMPPPARESIIGEERVRSATCRCPPAPLVLSRLRRRGFACPLTS